MGNSESIKHTVNLFYTGRPLPPEHGYQWVNDACQLNLFALPVCHQRHGELKLLHFFQERQRQVFSPVIFEVSEASV